MVATHLAMGPAGSKAGCGESADRGRSDRLVAVLGPDRLRAFSGIHDSHCHWVAAGARDLYQPPGYGAPAGPRPWTGIWRCGSRLTCHASVAVVAPVLCPLRLRHYLHTLAGHRAVFPDGVRPVRGRYLHRRGNHDLPLRGGQPAGRTRQPGRPAGTDGIRVRVQLAPACPERGDPGDVAASVRCVPQRPRAGLEDRGDRGSLLPADRCRLPIQAGVLLLRAPAPPGLGSSVHHDGGDRGIRHPPADGACGVPVAPGRGWDIPVSRAAESPGSESRVGGTTEIAVPASTRGVGVEGLTFG